MVTVARRTAHALALACLVALGPGAGAFAEAAEPRPLIWEHGFADPAVVVRAGRLVGAATGPVDAIRAVADAPGGPWRDTATAAGSRPAWSPGGATWAPDLARVGGRWLLYTAVRVEGLGAAGRCIAVAASDSPTGEFRPVGRRPLVCPAAADTPPAWDQVRGRAEDLPQEGVIDPSLFRARHGGLFLLYRTQGMPSTIRLVRLSPSGTRVPDGVRSKEMVRDPGIIENPVLLERRGRFVLLVSEGWFGHCRYRTLWQRADRILGWAGTRRRVLLDAAGTGLCGPGGADVVQPRPGRDVAYLHAWVCADSPTPCPADWTREPGSVEALGERRALYAVRLRWTATGRPYLGGWVQPR